MHPPSEYPRLYPKPVEYYRIAHWLFKWATRAIGLFGLALFFALLFVVDHSTFADDGYISEFWPAVYGAMQFLPLVALGVLEISQFKLMRQSSSATLRKADLTRRRLFDFVSPGTVVLTVILYVAAIVFDLHVHQYIFDLGHDTMQRALLLTATNLCFAVAGAALLHGRKLDPYQSSEDRLRRITVGLVPLFWTSMAMSLFFMLQAADDVFAMDPFEALVMSLYFQAVVILGFGHVLRSYKVEDIDFDAYRDPASTPAG